MRIWCLGLVTALLTLVLTGVSAAAPLRHPDSDAPPGASATWLPWNEPWVAERWLPFDQARLLRIFKTDVYTMHVYLDDGNRTLIDLAEEEHIPTNGLAARIMGRRDPDVPSDKWAERLARTQRILTQGHLSAHMLEHAFHQASVNTQTQLEFGVAPNAFQQLRYVQGISAQAIAARSGMTFAQTRDNLMRVAELSGDRGVQLDEMSPAQARYRMSYLGSQADNWLQMGSDGSPSAKAASAAASPVMLLCALR
jgi:hypothetical protein